MVSPCATLTVCDHLSTTTNNLGREHRRGRQGVRMGAFQGRKASMTGTPTTTTMTTTAATTTTTSRSSQPPVRLAALSPTTAGARGLRNTSGDTPIAPRRRPVTVLMVPPKAGKAFSTIPISMLPRSRSLSLSRPPPCRSRRHSDHMQPLLYQPRFP